MARERLCKQCKKWHPMDEPWPEECSVPRRDYSGGLSVPMIIHDGMEAVQSQTNGLYYDSKAALRSEYARAGVVEVGNERLENKPIQKPKRKDVQAAVQRAISKVELTSTKKRNSLRRNKNNDRRSAAT